MASPRDESVKPWLVPELPFWDPETDDRLVCRAVIEETHDVKTFVLAAMTPSRFSYWPGQFLTFEFEIGGETICRCYTISSSAARWATLSITVKRVPGGIVSNFLHDQLKVGDVVHASGPAGDFTCIERPASKYLFLSGGVGITPLMSMARTFADLAEHRDITFIHSARTPADIIFRGELDRMTALQPAMRVAHIVESRASEPGWPGFIGRLSMPLLDLLVPDLRERAVFCCGPSLYMSAVRAMLEVNGFDVRRYHEESFRFEDRVEPEIEPPAPAVVEEHEDAPAFFTVTFAKTGRAVECSPDTFILAAARAAGLALPSSCARGLCGTCKSRKLSGEVEMTHKGGIRQREIDNGLVLICCSKPRSDVVIDR